LGCSLQASSSPFPGPLKRRPRCESTCQFPELKGGLFFCSIISSSPCDLNAKNHWEEHYKMHFCAARALTGSKILPSVQTVRVSGPWHSAPPAMLISMPHSLQRLCVQLGLHSSHSSHLADFANTSELKSNKKLFPNTFHASSPASPSLHPRPNAAHPGWEVELGQYDMNVC